MPQLKKLNFKIHINAPMEKVWHQMLDPEPYSKWTSAFCEGSYYEGSWDAGQSIRFLSPTGEGMVSKIAENRKYQFISIRHEGFIEKGKDVFDSEPVKQSLPAYENYTFQSEGGGTDVVVDMDSTESYEKYFLETWPKALQKLKEISEA